MPAASPITRSSVGRTFVVAISVLGVAAVAQVGALAWAFVSRLPGTGSTVALETSRVTGPVARVLPRAVPPTRNDGEGFDTENPFAETPGFALPQPAATPPKPTPVPLSRLEAPPPETRFQELVAQGKTLRERGDMGNALTRLREAQALDPRSPLAIAEIAVTYEKMGLADRAGEQWKRIYEMGESAGVYWTAAEAKLKQTQAQALRSVQGTAGAPPGASAGAPVSSLRADAILGLGEITATDITDAQAEKRFSLKVPLRARGGTAIDVRHVVIQVLFYDMVDGKDIVQTNANVNSRWGTAPPDWENGETEILEVEYLQPIVTTSDTPKENRKYFGHIVRLYYKDELQDARAEPIRLASQFPAPPTLEKDSATP
ncbi:MAG TPA: hypothetical protein VF614_14785 [Chthoniobacteraceae bacterium]|jgi:hypothetical protein